MKKCLEASPERPEVPFANDLGGFSVPQTLAIFRGFAQGLSRRLTLCPSHPSEVESRHG